MNEIDSEYSVESRMKKLENKVALQSQVIQMLVDEYYSRINTYTNEFTEMQETLNKIL